MNTIRRVDNVMSLVVEPTRRRLSVTDRVPAPGHRDQEPGFLELDYASPVTKRTMRRHVARVVERPLTTETKRAPVAPRRAWVWGDGPALAAVVHMLEARGATVVMGDPSAWPRSTR